MRRLRALFGLYEGNPEEPVFAGAVEEVIWECSDEEEWDRLIAELKKRAPDGTTEWREGWIEIDIDPAIFAPPKLQGKAIPPALEAEGG